MSKSYGNTISLRGTPSVTRKKSTMQTDPARMRRTDPGEPERCPVWQLHAIYSDDDAKPGCTGLPQPGIGCLDCKNAGAGGDPEGAEALHSAAALSGRSFAAAQHHRRRLRARARLAQKRCATCARRWAWTTQ